MIALHGGLCPQIREPICPTDVTSQTSNTPLRAPCAPANIPVKRSVETLTEMRNAPSSGGTQSHWR